MIYLGGKAKIAKDLARFFNRELRKNQPFVDLFCGSCNIIMYIERTKERYANDKHYYLIEMWKALQNGWLPPKNISEKEYAYIKNNKNENPVLSGFAGFGCAFSGNWFGCYARDPKSNRNYCLNAYNSVLNKMRYLKNVKFSNKDYKDFILPKDSVVYCDIPYKNTTPYNKSIVGIFNHDEFYKWVIKNSKNSKIFVSEYGCNVPNKFKVVWEKNSITGVATKNNKKIKTQEVLFTYEK